MKPGLGKEDLRGVRDPDLAPGRLDCDRSDALRRHRLGECARWPRRAAPVLVAPDSFKGTMSAPTVAAAIGRGLAARRLARSTSRRSPTAARARWTCSLDRLGGELVGVRASDPLGREIEARFALLADGATARRRGRRRQRPRARRAGGARRRGRVERRHRRARRRGARTRRPPRPRRGGRQRHDRRRLGAVEAIEALGGIDGARLTVLCDVRTPFEQAAAVFGPQKGADAASGARLTSAASRRSGCPRGVPMTGAAGGLAGGLWARLGRRSSPAPRSCSTRSTSIAGSAPAEP